jgi:hypothetical protein
MDRLNLLIESIDARIANCRRYIAEGSDGEACDALRHQYEDVIHTLEMVKRDALKIAGGGIPPHLEEARRMGAR